MQRLLRTADWGADAVRDELRSHVVEGLGPGGVLIVYETGFVKKGTRSASCVTQRAHGLSEHPLWPCDGLDCGGRVTWATRTPGTQSCPRSPDRSPVRNERADLTAPPSTEGSPGRRRQISEPALDRATTVRR
jgi:hypothetical protein